MNGKKAIILIAAVAVAVAIGVIMWITSLDDEKEIPLPKNQPTELIKQEIDSLGNLPDSKFCQDAYDNVRYLIDNFYKPHPPQHPYGRLGKTQLENDQWKENLIKNLYSAYADKFIRQAFYVFRNSEWNIDDLKFIRNEYKTLQRSPLLERGSPVDKKFTEIQNIFKKYDEITGFITDCKNFSYLTSGLSNRFPILEVQGKISQSKTYLNKNEYVNNCTRLHNDLKDIPQVLFWAHIRYLDNKITYWSGLYPNYNSQKDYANNLYKPLKDEIDALDNDIYNASNFDSEYKRLTRKWSDDNARAYSYTYQ